MNSNRLSVILRLASFATLALVFGLSRTWAVPIQWAEGSGGNGHYYELVEGPGTTFQRITWDQAKAAADARSYLGLSGYLATVTSLSESQFVSAMLTDPGSGFAWLDGRQPVGSPEPGGNWQWVTTGEAWSFTNWDAGEPNNYYFGDVGGPPAGSPEDALHTRPGGAWNDLPHDAYLPGYLVEYSAVPEPATLLLLGITVLTFGCLHRRRR